MQSSGNIIELHLTAAVAQWLQSKGCQFKSHLLLYKCYWWGRHWL